MFNKRNAGSLSSERPLSLQLKTKPHPRKENQEISQQVMKTEDTKEENE
jgi:hypothetical protein